MMVLIKFCVFKVPLDWRLTGVPPKVRPTGLYAGVAGPASLTAASIALVNRRESAPRIVSMTLPDRKIKNVGILGSVRTVARLYQLASVLG